MPATKPNSIVVTRQDHERLLRLVETTSSRRRWEEIHLLAGTALLGYREGDVIEWPIPGGVRVLRVEALLHQPGAARRQREQESL